MTDNLVVHSVVGEQGNAGAEGKGGKGGEDMAVLVCNFSSTDHLYNETGYCHKTNRYVSPGTLCGTFASDGSVLSGKNAAVEPKTNSIDYYSIAQNYSLFIKGYPLAELKSFVAQYTASLVLEENRSFNAVCFKIEENERCIGHEGTLLVEKPCECTPLSSCDSINLTGLIGDIFTEQEIELCK